MHNFNSKQFKWCGNRGTAKIHTLLSGNKWENISRFSIKSGKTGKIRFYEIDSSVPGYQDGWDGEFTCYTDNLWDGTSIVILNT